MSTKAIEHDVNHFLASASNLLDSYSKREIINVIVRTKTHPHDHATIEKLVETVAALCNERVRLNMRSAQPCGCDPSAKWTCERHR